MICVNDMVEVEIIDITVDGSGIGKVDGYPLFIRGAVIGDKVKAVVTKTNKTYGFARLTDVVEASAYRVKPPCDYFDECGGCNIMHMNYEGQLNAKSNFVLNNLIKIGGCSPENFEYEGIIGAEDVFNYRNKAQFPVGKINGRAVCGFYKSKSHEIVPCTNCKIQNAAINTAVNTVMEFINKYNISIYDEKSHKGIVRHIYVRCDNNDGVMVVVVTNSEKRIDNFIKLVNMLCEKVQLKALIQNINTKKSNVVLGYENMVLWGDNHITASVDGIKFDISPNSFFQVNYKQMKKLYNKAREYADLNKTKTVFDLYCGVGSISLFMARHCQRVVGVEIVAAAIENAKNNAKLNKIENAEFFCGDCGEVVDTLINKGYSADVVIVDPPRKGCDEKTLSLINTISPKTLVYVSCNSSTLARDIAILKGFGYTLKKACAVDLFPNSTHIETVCLLCK